MQQPTEKRVALAGAELAYFEWGDPGAGPTVLLVHATGFHARCWDGVVRALGSDAPHLVALDLRGHGRSSTAGPHHWRQFGLDVAAFVAALDLDRIVGVGHSMGGHCVTWAAAAQASRFRQLLLVDPVIMAPGAYRRPPALGDSDVHPVARRRNRWESPEAMFRHFENRHPFSLWEPVVLRDYCRHGLLPAADGEGLVLACPPQVEAAIYLGSTGRDIGDVVAALPHPVTVLRAKPREAAEGKLDFSRSPTWPGLAAAFPKGRDVFLPALSHFIPMQRPALVAAHIRELLEAPEIGEQGTGSAAVAERSG